MSKKKTGSKKSPPPAGVTITRQKKDRVAAILAIMLGLLTIREGGSVLLGLTVPNYPVLPWLVWYNVAVAVLSVAAGVGMWKKLEWSITLSTNILALHATVFASLVGLSYFGQTVARISIFAMMFRTFTWIVIVSLLKWKREIK